MAAQLFRARGVRAFIWASFSRGSLGKYGLIGLVGVFADIALFGFLVLVGVLPVAATVASSFLGILTNYLANAMLNFRVSLNTAEATKFVLVGLVGLIVAAGILHLALVSGAGVWSSKVISLLLVVPGQFLAHKVWTFQRKVAIE
jgi:putative flippase GtrA